MVSCVPLKNLTFEQALDLLLILYHKLARLDKLQDYLVLLDKL